MSLTSARPIRVASPTSSGSPRSWKEIGLGFGTGGFPMALARESASARNRWFDDYVRLTLGRDVRELSNVRQAAMLPRLLIHRLPERVAERRRAVS